MGVGTLRTAHVGWHGQASRIPARLGAWPWDAGIGTGVRAHGQADDCRLDMACLAVPPRVDGEEATSC